MTLCTGSLAHIMWQERRQANKPVSDRRSLKTRSAIWPEKWLTSEDENRCDSHAVLERERILIPVCFGNCWSNIRRKPCGIKLSGSGVT